MLKFFKHFKYKLFSGEPSEHISITDLNYLKKENKILSNYTENLEERINELKFSQEALTTDHQNLNSSYQSLKVENERQKKLMYNFMGGLFGFDCYK